MSDPNPSSLPIRPAILLIVNATSEPAIPDTQHHHNQFWSKNSDRYGMIIGDFSYRGATLTKRSEEKGTIKVSVVVAKGGVEKERVDLSIKP